MTLPNLTNLIAAAYRQGYTDAVFSYEADCQPVPSVMALQCDDVLVDSLAGQTNLAGAELAELVRAYAQGYHCRAAEDAAVYAAR